VRRALAAGLLLAAGLAGAAAGLDGERAFRHVERLVAFGPRPSGSPALARARAWMLGELRRAGLVVREQAFIAVTPDGAIPMVNVVAELRGQRPEVIVLGGHYDTKYFWEFRFVGANDGGSSTGLLLELARVLGSRHRETPPPFTYWLVFFDGEEARREWSASDSLYGSRAFVRALQGTGELARLRAVIVVDMIGDRDLGIRREAASTPWLTELLWRTARRLGHGAHFLDAVHAVDDDHRPFLEVGVPAALLIDFDYGGRPGENAFWHTPEDTLDKVSARSLQVVGEVVLEALPVLARELTRRDR